QQTAQLVLTQFEEHPEAWTRVPEILEKSAFPQAKFIGLQILERLVTTRWKTLPEAQRQGIRNFIVSETVTVASDDAALRRARTYLAKLNLVLVQVLKQEWPHNWPTFIAELVRASTASLALCENNMAILKLCVGCSSCSDVCSCSLCTLLLCFQLEYIHVQPTTSPAALSLSRPSPSLLPSPFSSSLMVFSARTDLKNIWALIQVTRNFEVLRSLGCRFGASLKA
ncbi:armadillo-type protein, partial [Mycena vitilis]